MNFNFLNTLSEVEVPKEALKQNSKKVLGSRIPAQGSDFRVTKKGIFTPSLNIAKELDLAYTNSNSIFKGNGLDVVSSKRWVQYKEKIKAAIALNPELESQIEYPLFLAVTPRVTTDGKKSSKIDLLSSCKYNETGDPKGDIFTQLSISNVLIEGILECIFDENIEPENYYNDVEFVNLPAEERIEKRFELYTKAKEELVQSLIGKYFEEGFVDLKIHLDSPFTFVENEYFIPKVSSRGKDKGKATTVTRTDIVLYPISLIPKLELTNENKEGTEIKEEISETNEELSNNIEDNSQEGFRPQVQQSNVNSLFTNNK